VNIIKARSVRRDGSAPALLTGYGGFDISMKPTFLGAMLAWLEQGGVYAIANLRGGGEFGEKWHDAGRLTRKQNVFDDFYASAQYLVTEKFCDPRRLAIRGGSNGGLLMGAALTQHPEMYRAVLSSVGIYDMLRVENSSNGTFNIPEYGTVRDPEQFKALYAYSPYHHVVDDKPYPAVLFNTGANDARVEPMQSMKMVARLQTATTSSLPILLRYSATSGHGIGSPLSERIANLTDELAFLVDQLKIEYRPVGTTQAGRRM
jgi:prolyl oligopeptidase